MQVRETSLPGVLLIEPRLFEDDRGWFMETYNERAFRDAGITAPFVQDNHSFSGRNVVRGLHYQEPNPQGKLVRAATGTILDVAVDIRKDSPTFGQWCAYELSADNRLQLWVPPGFAHGFSVLSETADVIYKCTALYDGPSDRAIAWNDPDLGIDWKIDGEARLSAKDAAAPRLAEATILPSFLL